MGEGIKYQMPTDYKPKPIGRPRSPELGLYSEPWPEYRFKKCTMCLEVKQCREFHRAQHKSDGYQARCKICQIISVQQTRDKQRALAYARQYNLDHREERSLISRYYYSQPEIRQHIRAGRKRRRLEKTCANV